MIWCVCTPTQTFWLMANEAAAGLTRSCHSRWLKKASSNEQSSAAPPNLVALQKVKHDTFHASNTCCSTNKYNWISYIECVLVRQYIAWSVSLKILTFCRAACGVLHLQDLKEKTRHLWHNGIHLVETLTAEFFQSTQHLTPIQCIAQHTDSNNQEHTYHKTLDNKNNESVLAALYRDSWNSTVTREQWKTR